jgi:hypothetical protein
MAVNSRIQRLWIVSNRAPDMDIPLRERYFNIIFPEPLVDHKIQITEHR